MFATGISNNGDGVSALVLSPVALTGTDVRSTPLPLADGSTDPG